LQHAQHTKAAKSDKMKASVLALDVQSKMFDASMGEAVVRQKQQAEHQTQRSYQGTASQQTHTFAG
jgi:hypothetical protein